MEIARIDRGATSVSADSAKVSDIPHGASCRTVEEGDRFPVQFYAVCSPMYSPVLLPSGNHWFPTPGPRTLTGSDDCTRGSTGQQGVSRPHPLRRSVDHE